MNKNLVFGPDKSSIAKFDFGGYPDNSHPRIHPKGSGFSFEYVMSGNINIESPDYLISAGIGDLVIIHPSEECVIYRNSGDVKTVALNATGFVLEAMYDVLALPRVFCASVNIVDKMINAEGYYSKYAGGDCNSGRKLYDLVISLITDAAAIKTLSETDHKATAKDIKEYLDLCLCGDINLDGIGKRFGISSMHVIRLFRAEYDITPMQYLKNARLEKASKLLRKSKMTIKEIASLLRFSSTQHFTNLFREHFGVSPGKFREKKTK